MSCEKIWSSFESFKPDDFFKVSFASINLVNFFLIKTKFLRATCLHLPLDIHIIAELPQTKRASEAPLVRKIGNPSSRENLVMTSPSVRSSSVQTLGDGEGRLNVTCDFGCYIIE